MSTERTEWGIWYPGEPEPRIAPADEGEWRARSWADYWNSHQIAVDKGRAVVVSRTVVTSDWTTTPDEGTDPMTSHEEAS